MTTGTNHKARCFSAVAAFQVLMTFISPALWVLTTPQSIMARVANLAYSSELLGACWLAAATLVLPFVVMQLGWPDYEHRRIVTKICNYGNITGGLIWFFMAFIARNLDYDYIIFNFLFNGIGSIALAALLADGLNDTQVELPVFRKKVGL